MRYKLNEAKLSRNLAAPFIKAFKQLGLTESEANYFMNLYGELRKQNLLNSRMFKPTKPSEVNPDQDLPGDAFIVDYEGKLPDIKQLQVLARDPETLLDVFNYVINNPAFLSRYKIHADEEDVTLEKITVKKQKEDLGQAIHYQYLKPIAQDKNWVTYNPRTARDIHHLKNHYFKDNVTEEEREIIEKSPEGFRLSYFLFPWCIAESSSTRYFKSQMVDRHNDLWYVTLTKKRPIEIYNEYIKDKGPISESTFRTKIGDPHIGEVYLKNTTGGGTNTHRYGYYPYRNGAGAPTSDLANGPTYSYDTLEVADNRPFIMEGTTLMKVNVNEFVVNVPAGVREVADGAFKNLGNVGEINFPVTTLIIHSGAIQNLPKLKYIEVSNNFIALEENAIDNIVQLDNTGSNHLVMIGVFDKESKVFKRPLRLQYMQTNLLKEYKLMGGTE